jgi:LPXTG-motif cell wall-anchored protein
MNVQTVGAEEMSAKTPVAVTLSRPITENNLPGVDSMNSPQPNHSDLTIASPAKDRKMVSTFPKTSELENTYLSIAGILLLLMMIGLYVFSQKNKKGEASNENV